MDTNRATEIAYKNGYRQGQLDAVRMINEIIHANYAVSEVPYIDGEEPTTTYQLTNWDLRAVVKKILEGG